MVFHSGSDPVADGHFKTKTCAGVLEPCTVMCSITEQCVVGVLVFRCAAQVVTTRCTWTAAVCRM